MVTFFNDLAQFAFLQNALLMGLLSSVASGIIGTYVVVRRISYIAGGISHCVLGGMGAAMYLNVTFGWPWMHPLLGALVAALVAAAIIGVVSLRAKQREDTVISALWAVGMAIGILFLAKTPGFNQELTGYLFGSLLLVPREHLWIVLALDVLLIALALVFYNQFFAVCFDEEFARLRGVPVESYYLLLIGLTALTVVVLSVAVGIILVIALLTLPVAIAGMFARTLWQTMLLSTLIGATVTTAGLALSYGPDWPSGATTILILGAAYLLTIVVQAAAPARRRPAAATPPV